MTGSRFRYSGMKIKCTILAASFLIASLSLAGCFETRSPRTARSQANAEVKPGTPTEASPTPTLTPTPDPKDDAVKLASEVGLTEEDLRGKYDLFIRYAEVVGSNPEFNGRREFIYHLFPVIAEHLKSENEEFFFGKVKELKITQKHTDGIDGQYIQTENKIELDPDLETRMGKEAYSSVFYHELMHFIDLNIAGSGLEGYACLMDDGSIRKHGDLDYGEMRHMKDYLYSYFIEGGAEMYTSEYFTYAPNSYLPRVRFLVGMKYILGVEKIDNMFFDVDTDYQFAQLLMVNGFTTEETVKVFMAMRNTPDALSEPKTLIDPREVLIRLYINNVGPDYEKDKTFCLILGSMNESDLNKIPSDYSKFYTKLSGVSQEDVLQVWGYLTNIVGDYDVQWGFIGLPAPLYLNGELKLAVTAGPTEGNKLDYKAVVVDYDFEKNEIKDITIHEKWSPEPLPDL
ncbi:MAG: hypothetical protein IKM96_05440 [Clostridiales bacterium]|nr:hypothetical protein [Clostridiales bacterium]